MSQRTEKKNRETLAGHRCKTAAYLNRRACCFFSQYGIHGARLEQVAERAGVSKTNLLYYYPSKEALYVAVMRQITDIWLAPLKAFRAEFSPLEAIKEYIRLKLEVSRDYPQASRLFCMEMLAGAPLLMEELTGDLKALIDEKIRADCRMGAQRETGARLPAPFDLHDLGRHATLRRFCPSG